MAANQAAHQRGFTLIELMIVVAVMGALVAAAVPSYNKYQQKSRRADAAAFMMNMDVRQKQILIEQRGYATAPNALNVAGTGWTCTSTACSNVWYQINFEDAADANAGAVTNTATPPTYTICAKPIQGSQTSDGTLTLKHDGSKKRVTGTTCTSAGTDLGW